jgi:hypothetical protein
MQRMQLTFREWHHIVTMSKLLFRAHLIKPTATEHGTMSE